LGRRDCESSSPVLFRPFPLSALRHDDRDARDKPKHDAWATDHGAWTIDLHVGGKPASVRGGFGFGGMSGGGGCRVDSLNQ
jgi:hypothetical protein